MKIFVKTLKGTHFEVEVKLEDKIADVKKSIESVQGAGVYPAAQQMLIHQGKVLKDETTLEENQVAENSFVVIMLSKTKTPTGGSSALTTASTAKTSAPVPPAAPQPSAAPLPPASPQPPTASSTASSPAPAAAAQATLVTAGSESDVYGQAASNLVAGTNLEGTIQQILDMGGGTWDRETVLRALRAAFNNPERAIEYLYSGIPDVAPVAPAPALGSVIPPAQPPQTELTVPATLTSSGPNANPLDLFPQGLPSMGSNTAGAGTLDFLRNSQQFQALRTMVQTNPQILQPMLQELGKQNPNLMRLIQDHQSDFLRLINEPAGGGAGAGVAAEGNTRNQTDVGAVPPQSVTVTPEERQAIDRLEAMGFERALVLQVFFACNKNEELAANYLLDHMNEFDE